jgi:hypothetical protein
MPGFLNKFEDRKHFEDVFIELFSKLQCHFNALFRIGTVRIRIKQLK